jgi:hypothetical protein
VIRRIGCGLLDKVVKGQMADWKLHHKLVCKSIAVFVASNEYQALDMHQRTEAVLLSHILLSPQSQEMEAVGRADTSSLDCYDLGQLGTNPLMCMLALIPQTDPHKNSVALPNMARPLGESLSANLYARFPNNNFLLHSHLNAAYAQGVYPVASRTLNHSCVPNAAPKFVLEEGKIPRMDVVALATIDEGQEVGAISKHYSALSLTFLGYNFLP